LRGKRSFVQEKKEMEKMDVVAHFKGQIIEILVDEGAKLKRGISEILRIAISLDNGKSTVNAKVKSPVNGTVSKIHVLTGDNFAKNDILMELDLFDSYSDSDDSVDGMDMIIDELLDLAPDKTKIVDPYHPNYVPLSKSMLKIRHRWDSHYKRLASKKMILLCDIDNTLVHTTRDESLISCFMEGENFMNHFGKLDISYFSAFNQNVQYLIKFRPGVRSFLKEISLLFDVYLVTLASSEYAHMIMSFLDPEEKHIKGILSREDMPSMVKAARQAVSEEEEGSYIILDDREDVWSYYSSNGILKIGEYRFFPEKDDVEETSKLYKFTEEEASVRVKDILSSGVEESHKDLQEMLRVMKNVHNQYFELLASTPTRNLEDTFASDIVKEIRSRVLSGVVIAFSNPQNPIFKSLFRMSISMGAVCVKLFEGNCKEVTHIIIFDNDFESQFMAEAFSDFHSVILVRDQWIRDCSAYWTRISEEDYRITML